MIDLRERRLQDSIVSKGVEYPLDTDFRTWIAFQHTFEEEGVALFDIFSKKRPPLDDREWVATALEFLRNENATPRATGRASGNRAIDMVLDGEYIVASFQSAYGIDLTDPDLRMHWHRFKALLNGLPEDAKMAQVIGIRTWQRSSKKYETVMAEQREAWRLPEVGHDAAMEEARKVAEMMWEEQNGA